VIPEGSYNDPDFGETNIQIQAKLYCSTFGLDGQNKSPNNKCILTAEDLPPPKQGSSPKKDFSNSDT